MAQINSYADAVTLFSRCRKPELGRTLKSKGWRLYKDGDEFLLSHYGHPFARVLPNNTLYMLGGGKPTQGSVAASHAVVPVDLRRKGVGHYRVRVLGGAYSVSYRLYDGLTVDLDTRTAVGYREPELEVRPDLRKTWLRDLRSFRAMLKTMVRLGVFTALYDEVRKDQTPRWNWSPMTSARSEDVAMLNSAMLGDEQARKDLTLALARAMVREFWQAPSLGEQYAYVERVITSNSLALRILRGVVTLK